MIRNFIQKDKPFFVHMSLTKRCNLRCIYCKSWKEPPNSNELSTSQWLKVVDILDEIGVYAISFTGGEPLLKPGVFDIIRHVCSKGLHAQITSNGTLPIHLYRELIDTNIHVICISLDSAGANTQDGLSQVKGSWEKAVNTIQFLRANARSHQIVYVTTVITPNNINEIMPILEFCSNTLQVPISLQPVIIDQGNNDSNFAFRPKNSDMLKFGSEEIEKLYQNLYRRPHNLKLVTPHTFLRISQQYLQANMYKWKCKAGRLFFDIMPDGRLYLCQDVPFPEKKYILEDGFATWLKSHSYKNIAKQLSNDCSGCCYSCYINVQHIYSWKLPAILAANIKNFNIYKHLINKWR